MTTISFLSVMLIMACFFGGKQINSCEKKIEILENNINDLQNEISDIKNEINIKCH